MDRTRDRTLGRICALLAAIAVAVLLQRIFLSPAGLVVFPDARAPWIRADEDLDIRVKQWGREQVPVTRFVGTLRVPSGGLPPEASLEVRALREYAIELDGRPLTHRLPQTGASRIDLSRDWKSRARLPLPADLPPGDHLLSVAVRNPLGPPLLSLRLVGAPVALSTAEGWIAVREDGTRLATVEASDVSVHPSARASPSTGGAVVALRSWLALFAVGGLALFGAARWSERGTGPRAWPVPLALGALVGFWLALFLLKFLVLPIGTGFDARPHLRYLDFVREQGRLPLPSDGWSMYHPPLFYLASALVARAAAALGVAQAAVPLKILPALAGLGTACVACLLVRRLLPGDRRALLFAIGLAAVLPMNCYIAGYFTNEGLHAFLASCLVLSAVVLLQEEELRPRRILLFSLLVALAVLTKHTGLAVGGVASLFVLVETLRRGDRSARRTLGRLALLGGPMLLVAGWYYAWSWIELGTPWQAGWDARGPGRIWWSAPGFHTPGYFLGFGESLVRPFFAGHHSFWDGLYSTLWGDGLLAGRTGWESRHGRWNYDFMAAGYLLALPATLLVGAGMARCARQAWRDPAPGRRAALALPLAVTLTLGFLIVLVNLQAPGYSQVKAFYGLAASASIVLFFGAGAGALDGWLEARGWPAARWLLVAWYAALVGCLAAAFLA